MNEKHSKCERLKMEIILSHISEKRCHLEHYELLYMLKDY